MRLQRHPDVRFKVPTRVNTLSNKEPTGRPWVLTDASGRANDSYCLDDGRLADVDRKLALVRTVTDVGAAHLRRIQARMTELLAQVESGP